MSALNPQQKSISQRLADEIRNGLLNLSSAPKTMTIPVPPDKSDTGSLKKTIMPVMSWIDQASGNAGSILDKHLTLRDLMNEGLFGIMVGNVYYSGNDPRTVGLNIAANQITAREIEAGTITTEKLVVDAATVAADAGVSSAYGSGSGVATMAPTGYDVLTLDTTGAPVTVIGYCVIDIDYQGAGALTIEKAGIQVIIKEGATALFGVIVLEKTFLDGVAASHRRVTVSVPIMFRYTPAAGSHTFTSWQVENSLDSSGAGTVVGTTTFQTTTYLIATENKV